VTASRCRKPPATSALRLLTGEGGRLHETATTSGQARWIHDLASLSGAPRRARRNRKNHLQIFFQIGPHQSRTRPRSRLSVDKTAREPRQTGAACIRLDRSGRHHPPANTIRARLPAAGQGGPHRIQMDGDVPARDGRAHSARREWLRLPRLPAGKVPGGFPHRAGEYRVLASAARQIGSHAEPVLPRMRADIPLLRRNIASVHARTGRCRELAANLEGSAPFSNSRRPRHIPARNPRHRMFGQGSHSLGNHRGKFARASRSG